jgi:hypothetical protein
MPCTLHSPAADAAGAAAPDPQTSEAVRASLAVLLDAMLSWVVTALRGHRWPQQLLQFVSEAAEATIAGYPLLPSDATSVAVVTYNDEVHTFLQVNTVVRPLPYPTRTRHPPLSVLIRTAGPSSTR